MACTLLSTPAPAPCNPSPCASLTTGVAYDGYLSRCTAWFDNNADGIQATTDLTAQVGDGGWWVAAALARCARWVQAANLNMLAAAPALFPAAPVQILNGAFVVPGDVIPSSLGVVHVIPASGSATALVRLPIWGCSAGLLFAGLGLHFMPLAPHLPSPARPVHPRTHTAAGHRGAPGRPQC